MASLLSFVGNAAQKVGHVVNQDVVQPAIRDVYQPIQHVAAPVERAAVNTFAPGVVPAFQAAQHFAAPISQGINNAANFLQQHPLNVPIVKPIETHFVAPVLQNYGQTVGHTGQILNAHNPYHGTAPQIAGQVGNDLLNAASVLPLGAAAKGVQAGVKGERLLPSLARSGGINAGFGGAYGVAQAAQQKGITPKLALKAGLQNAAIAGGVGVGLPLAGRGVRVGAQQTAKAIENRVPLNAVGAVGKNVKGVPKLPSEFDSKVTAKLTQNVPKATGTNPLAGKVGVPDVAAGDAGQAHLNAQFIAQHEQRVGGAAQTELAKLSPKDQTLMKQIQTKGVDTVAKKADNPQQFVKTEGAIRNYYNLRHAYDNYLGIATPYRQNYLRDLLPPQELGTTAAKGGSLTPGYIQHKTLPGRTDVAEGLQRDINGASFNHAKLTYAQGLEQAFPGQISRGSPIVGPSGVTQQLQNPYGNELFATKGVAKGINARAPVGKVEGALGKYDKLNALAKYTKLSGGAFHALTEAGNFTGQQLMSGHNPVVGAAQLAKVFTRPGAFAKEVAGFESRGTMDKARLGGLTWKPGDIKADVNVTPHGAVAKYTGLKALHDATFQRELPYIKLKMFEQKTQGLDVNNPADLAKIRESARGINSGIGGINRMVEGMSPQTARRASRALLAADFTEGKIRTIQAALSKGGEEGKIAREIVAGKALLFAGAATAGGAATGEFKNKTPQEIATNILGKFANPSFKAGGNTVSLPATHVSEFTKPLASFVNGSKDKFGGLKNYATARLAAIPSEANQLINNMDYSGNHIYGKNTVKNGGAPISGPQAGVNIAKGVLPIPVGQAASTVQGKQNIPAAIANIAGLRVAPTPAPKVTANSNIPNATPAQKQTQADAQIKQLKTNAKSGYGLTPLPNGKYEVQIGTTFKTFSDLPSARLAIAKDSLKNSNDSTKSVNGNVLVKDANGKVKAYSQTDYQYTYDNKKLTETKANGDITGWMSTAQDYKANLIKQISNPKTDPLNALKLQGELASLNKDISKFTDYGGFSKPKTGSDRAKAVAKVPNFKLASTKLKAPKVGKISVKGKSAPKFKAARVASAKSSTPKAPKLNKKTPSVAQAKVGKPPKVA